MANSKSYDVFISYRREGGLNFARSIAIQLRAMGYQCFFDQHELKSGPFNRQICEAIEHSKHFIVVLTEGALDRCADPEDWVRKEIEHAKRKDIPVVPVAVHGKPLTFPESLPESLAWLKSSQASFIDLERYFEDTTAKMVRDQMPSLWNMTGAQHRRVRRQAEKVFLKRAARFKGNDGVIDAEERAELELLADASGINRIRLEELVERVESAAIARARAKAWMKSHLAGVSLFGVVLFALIAWTIGKALPPPPPAEDGGSAGTEERADSPSREPPAAPPPTGEKAEDIPAAAPAQDVPPGETATPPKKKAETKKPAGEGENPRPGETGKTADPIQSAAQRLGKLTSRAREWAEADFRNSLRKQAKLPERAKNDPVALRIFREHEAAAAEGRKLHRLGMQPKELIKTRPDLVLRFADLRTKVKNEQRQLIKDNRQEEALVYYISSKTAFDALGMKPLSRPSFSK